MDRSPQEKYLRPFGEALRLRRERLRLSQRDVGEFVGIHHTTVGQMERSAKATRSPQRVYEKLAQLLQGTVDELKAGYVPPYFPMSTPPLEALESEEETLRRALSLLPNLPPEEVLQAVREWESFDPETRRAVWQTFLAMVHNFAVANKSKDE